MDENSTTFARRACERCGRKLDLKKEDRYTVIGGKILHPVYFGAFDCPYCGCQNVVGVRMNRLRERKGKNEQS